MIFYYDLVILAYVNGVTVASICDELNLSNEDGDWLLNHGFGI